MRWSATSERQLPPWHNAPAMQRCTRSGPASWCSGPVVQRCSGAAVRDRGASNLQLCSVHTYRTVHKPRPTFRDLDDQTTYHNLVTLSPSPFSLSFFFFLSAFLFTQY